MNKTELLALLDKAIEEEYPRDSSEVTFDINAQNVLKRLLWPDRKIG